MLHAINYTSYESLTCEDAYWWMDMVTNTFPADQCVSHIRHDYLPWSNSYAYTTGGFSEGYYNGSSCWEAPMYYMKHKSMSTDTDTTCHSGGDGESFGVNKGCEYFYQYHNDHCSGPVYEIHPMKQIMDKCWEKDVDYGLPVMGLFDHHHGLDMDLFRIAYFCGNGQPDGSNTICMNEDGSPCHDMFQSNYEGFVGVPSSTSRICKPHDNDDELKVEFVHLVRDSSTHQGAAKITIKTPDYVSTTDRFRIVVKLFGEGQKKVIDSFKFNGRPENNTLTFQTEGHYSPPFEPREATVKVKQRVYDKERPFVRKSCVKFDLHQDDDVCPPMVHGICRAGRTLDSSACGHFDDGGERVFADGRTDEEMYSLGFSCSVTCGGIDEGHRANPDPNGGVDCVDVYNTYNDAYNCCVES